MLLPIPPKFRLIQAMKPNRTPWSRREKKTEGRRDGFLCSAAILQPRGGRDARDPGTESL
jgi:hypothetical protein